MVEKVAKEKTKTGERGGVGRAKRKIGGNGRKHDGKEVKGMSGEGINRRRNKRKKKARRGKEGGTDGEGI